MSRTATLPARRRENVPQATGASVPMLRSPAPPAWLAAWHPGEAIPASLGEIEAALTSFEDATAPSERVAIARALAPAIDLFGAPAEFDRKVDVYMMLLADVPEDLLAYGVFSAMRDGEFFPRPNSIREPISDEMSRRLHIRLRLGTAFALARRSQEQRARIKQSA